MFNITLDIGALPVPDAMVKTAMQNIAQEVGRPVVASMRVKLLRSRGSVPANRLQDFDRYVKSLDIWFAGPEDVRIGGDEAFEQTGLDLEFGENNMPYVPHIRTATNLLMSRINAVASTRMLNLARSLTRGVTMTRKVIR